MIELIVIIVLFWWACNSTVSWWKYKTELKSLKEESKSTFDMSASEAAHYVMETLEVNIGQANDFVTQMAIEERVHIRAIKVGESINSPVPPGIFEDHELFLIGDDNQRAQAHHFGSAFSENGWIVKGITQELNYSLLYDAPRFKSKELAKVCSWYNQSRPN